MFRDARPLVVPLCLIALLAACGQEVTAPLVVRPAMVVQPLPSAQSVDSFPGEVRARFELIWRFAFPARSASAWSRKGSGSRPIKHWPSWMRKTYACNWRPPVPRPAPQKPICNWSALIGIATKPCWIGRWSAVRSTTTQKTSIGRVKRGSSRSRPN